MNKSPFKFLDSYTQSDRDIFFGRESEIEEVYSRLFYSKLLLVYGPSGSGKTSLLQCGVANRFGEQNWKPIFIRRKQNIIQSIHSELGKQAITKLKEEKSITKKLYSLYLDYFTPVYLVFDQFEELFIFGNADEKKEFVAVLKDILSHEDLNTQIILSIREEYLASLSEFEDELPQLFENRIRIEKMKKAQALSVIVSPCEVCNVGLEQGLPELALEKIISESATIELTWMQVLMDRLYKSALERNIENVEIKLSDLEALGKIGDVLGSFLEEQLKLMPEGEKGEAILKTLVSTDGTKRQLTLSEIKDALETIGHKIEIEKIQKIVQHFITVRILSDKDENDRYELKHDSLAAKVYERLTLVEKELLEVRQYIEYAYQNYQSRGKFLSEDDLKYIAPYEGKLILSSTMNRFILDSRKALIKTRRRKRNIWISVGMVLLLIMLGFTWWANRERASAIKQKAYAEEQRIFALDQKKIAEEQKEQAQYANMIAEMAKDTALRAKEIVEKELYLNISNSLSISPTAMNVLYYGVENPIDIAASGIGNQKLFLHSFGHRLDSTNNKSEVVFNPVEIVSRDNKYFVSNISSEISDVFIGARGITSRGDTLELGVKHFRVKELPVPTILIGQYNGGNISKSELLKYDGISIDNITDWDVNYKINGFTCYIEVGGDIIPHKSNKRYFTDEMIKHFKNTLKGSRIYIENIIIQGPQGKIKAPLVVFTIEGDLVNEEKDIEMKINNLLDLSQKYSDIKNFKKAYLVLKEAYHIDSSSQKVKRALVENYFALNYIITSQVDYPHSYEWLKENYVAVYSSGSSGYLSMDFLASGLYNFKYDSLHLIFPFKNLFIRKVVYLDILDQFVLLGYKKNNFIPYLFWIDSKGSLKSEYSTSYSSIPFSFSTNSTGDKIVTLRTTESKEWWHRHDGRAVLFNVLEDSRAFLWGEKYKNYDLDGMQSNIVPFVRFNSDSKYIIAPFTWASKFEIWDTLGNFISRQEVNGKIQNVTFTPSNEILYTIEESVNNLLTIKLYKVNLSGEVLQFIPAEFEYDQVAFTNDGYYVIFVTKSGTNIYKYTGELIYSIPFNLPVISRNNNLIIKNDILHCYRRTYGNWLFPLLNPIKSIMDLIENDKIFGEIDELTDTEKNELEKITK